MNKLDLTHAKEMELYSYQIALLTIINNCNLEITRIKGKLAKVKREDKDEQNKTKPRVPKQDC